MNSGPCPAESNCTRELPGSQTAATNVTKRPEVISSARAALIRFIAASSSSYTVKLALAYARQTAASSAEPIPCPRRRREITTWGRLLAHRRNWVLLLFREDQAIRTLLDRVAELLQVLSRGTDVLQRLVQALAVALHCVIQIAFQTPGVD